MEWRESVLILARLRQQRRGQGQMRKDQHSDDEATHILFSS